MPADISGPRNLLFVVDTLNDPVGDSTDPVIVVVSIDCFEFSKSLAVRLGTRTSPVSDVIVVIFVVNLLVLTPIAGVVEYPQYNLTLVSLLAFAVAGLLESLVARFCYFVGIARIGASRTEPLKALFLVIAVGVAVIFLNEYVTAQLLLGIALILGGSSAVVIETRASPITATGRRLWLDMMFPLTAALFLGIDPIFPKIGLAGGTPALAGVTIRTQQEPPDSASI